MIDMGEQTIFENQTLLPAQFYPSRLTLPGWNP
jgi:hypothetical protein